MPQMLMNSRPVFHDRAGKGPSLSEHRREVVVSSHTTALTPVHQTYVGKARPAKLAAVARADYGQMAFTRKTQLNSQQQQGISRCGEIV